MMQEGRIRMNEAEHAAIDKLQGEHEEESIGVTRRDPGETGPLIATVAGTEYLIGEDGKRKKVS